MIKNPSDPLRREGQERTYETESLDLAAFAWRLSFRSPTWRPPTDFYETETHLVVRVEIAGMREDDFHIELNGRLLSIRGLRQDAAERRAYHQMEIRYGEFSIDVELPYHVDADQVQALYQDGFLRVFLPKAQPRHIPIVE